MAYPAIAIANAFLDIAKEKNVGDLTPMKLQKLVYFAHGWNLGATATPLINEQIEAWQYGPVVKSIYDVAKQYGNRPINSYLSTYVPTPNGDWVHVPCLLNSQDLHQVKPLLAWVLDQYGSYSGIQLSNLTHAADTPWKKTVDLYKGVLPYSTDIDSDVIQSYFSEKLKTLFPQAQAAG